MIKEDSRPAATWVTPTRRLAHFLRTRHDEACVAQGLEVWRTPDIVTWSELIRRMFELDRQAGRVVGRWLPEAPARVAWERIVRRDPAAAHLVAAGPLGRVAQASWQRMHAYRIPVAALAEEDRPESTAFRRWATEYSTWLERNGWVDAALADRHVHPAAAQQGLEFVGFDLLTPAQEAFVERMAQAGVAVSRRGAEAYPGSAAWIDCLDREHELDVAARWAARRLDGRRGARVAIVVPGLAARRDAVRRAVERVIAPATTLSGGPAPEALGFELASASPLSAHPITAAALAILGAFGGTMDLAHATLLLRSPFLAADAGEADARARLDAHLRRTAGPAVDLPRLAQSAGRGACQGFAAALRAGLDAVRDWPRQALPSHWTRLWFEALAAVGWPGTALDSDEHQAHERVRRLLAEFGATDDCTGAVAAGEALAMLRDLAEATLFAPQELRAALLVIDPETCAGMDFDGVWVCGLDTTQWPAPVAPDPFLPRDWQERQGLPGSTPDLAAAAARRVFERLCASAPEVIFSVPRFQDEAALLPSALVAGLPRLPLPDLWCAPAVAAAQFAARPSLDVLTDTAFPAVRPAETARGGARLLELQAACPFRAQAELRLGARALEDPALGVAARHRGELVHEVLAALWEALGDQAHLRALPSADLRRLTQEAIATVTTRAAAGSDDVMRHLLEIETAWLEARVLELMAAELARPPFSVQGLEQERSLEIGGLSLGLRIDRIDRLADGRLAIIDYKTSADARASAWFDARPRLPQLPLYAEAVGADQVAALAFGRVRTGDTGYSGVAGDEASFPGLLRPGARGWPSDCASWTELQQAWRRRLATLATEHAGGDARLAPDPAHACAHCPLGALCRIGETRLAVEAEGGPDE